MFYMRFKMRVKQCEKTIKKREGQREYIDQCEKTIKKREGQREYIDLFSHSFYILLRATQPSLHFYDKNS